MKNLLQNTSLAYPVACRTKVIRSYVVKPNQTTLKLAVNFYNLFHPMSVPTFLLIVKNSFNHDVTPTLPN